MSNTPLRLGLAGLGTVGVGVVKILQRHGAMLEARCGRPVRISAVSARSRARDRGVDLSAYAWEDDPVALARREDVDVLVEMIGGEDGPAKAAAVAALSAGKHVVTANKAMLARHGQELAELAEAAGAALRFEAAVAGGIPVVKALTEGLAANRVERVMGVMNGTCNYILTQMERTGADYAEVLAEAQRLGYAEADPAFDVGGVDAAHKLALLAAAAFGTRVDFEGVAIEGIERISLADIRAARDMGYRIKLLGVARMTEDGLEQRMTPCLVPAASALGQLDGVTNAVVLEGDFVGQTVFEGPGAGEGPTASAIMADVMDIAAGVRRPVFGAPAARLTAAPRAMDATPAAFYLRLTLADAPGVLAKIAFALGEEGVSIHRMRQYDHEGAAAPVLIVTHPARRVDIDAAMGRIGAMDESLATPVALRIEKV
ncbi:homoserine dehydrogenase [Oceanicella actignis]|uniref:Homoserine dehydrogenase n=1 Tax=Oceanicella actignis TaxID=1189325 RepID=A0A1M7SQ59_9RHOB|nr:homoserine dehydrogenase [Oceanicella actignis]TYO90823.1 homoserine dehydrogenase [Oceanicella actignis]SES66572.1 homoserine dehydrogenase [Oceanicella actignis]SHN60625.1 homoserine dehydrogenase [Oceanicella actignis]